MKILAPLNSPKETEELIRSGADEIYCGVLPYSWRRGYANVACVNRREWKAANLSSYVQLEDVADIAHSYRVPVYLSLNALYTKRQYPLVYEQIELAKKVKVDALIVADLGLLLNLRKENLGIDIHLSTGGTTFNAHTAGFYEKLGVSRVILPRHLQINEIAQIVKRCPRLKFEVFILNSGCKNIDGFCTFQHGVNELLYPRRWNLPKKLNIDRHLLNTIRRLPKKLAQRMKGGIFGIDSACLLNFGVSSTNSIHLDKTGNRSNCRNIAFSFNLLSGVDTCGVCRLSELKEIGVYAVKIIGRNYSTQKKVKDIKFLKTILAFVEENHCQRKVMYAYTKDAFRKIYKIDCGNLCYYPDGM